MQKTLFDIRQASPPINLLPMDGYAYYFPALFDQSQSQQLFTALAESLHWQPDTLWMFGQRIVTRRKVAWVGNMGCSYTYSGVKKSPQAWTAELLSIKNQLEELAKSEFNSCLLNFYHDGDDGMGWHSDDEKELDPNSPIASLSLGAQRKFSFRHKVDKITIPLNLENGSVLMMHSPTQQFWRHALLKTKTVSTPRINLTLRKIKLHHG
jgi:alkylated DNA repair dioxygenase AlkB